jgi:DNA repair exonuclease SbcCD ATPase subunit
MPILVLLHLLAVTATLAAAVLMWNARTRIEARMRELATDRDAALEAERAALAREAEALRDLAPLKIRDYLLSTHAQLQRFCRTVEAAHREARREIERCSGEISRLQERGGGRASEVEGLSGRREALLAVTRAMQPDLGELQHQCEFPEPFTVRVARIPPEAIRELARGYQSLAAQLALEVPEEMPDLSARVAESCAYRLDERTLYAEARFARTPEPAEVWQRPDNGE